MIPTRQEFEKQIVRSIKTQIFPSNTEAVILGKALSPFPIDLNELIVVQFDSKEVERLLSGESEVTFLSYNLFIWANSRGSAFDLADKLEDIAVDLMCSVNFIGEEIDKQTKRHVIGVQFYHRSE